MTNLYGVSRRRIFGETWFLIALAVVAIVGIAALVFGIRWLTAEPRGKLQAREQIQSGSNRIAAYNLFFDRCAQVQADEATLAALNAELAAGPSIERAEQIKATITGVTAGRAEKIAQYNVDARKDYTSGQFRASGLPYQLSPSDKETSCVA